MAPVGSSQGASARKTRTRSSAAEAADPHLSDSRIEGRPDKRSIAERLADGERRVLDAEPRVVEEIVGELDDVPLLARPERAEP